MGYLRLYSLNINIVYLINLSRFKQSENFRSPISHFHIFVTKWDYIGGLLDNRVAVRLAEE